MHRNRAFVLALGTSVAAAAIPLLVSCLSDPRAEDADVPTPACDSSNYKTLLSSEPTSVEATLRTFVEASLELKAATDEVESQMTDACNALAAELTLPQGQDLKAACKQLADRVDGINTTAPPALAPNAYPAQVRIVPSCHPQPGALEACLATCGATACTPGKCEANARTQKCDGTCKGKCITTGTGVACKGNCIGDIPLTGPLPCAGECTGVCTAPVWTGKCEGACAGSFLGFCAGTCTGLCNNQPINPQAPTDAGPPPGPVENPPNNAPANCQGFCMGKCSSGADGFCNSYPCYFPDAGPTALAPFNGSCTVNAGGACIPAGPTAALCRSADGSGTTTTCNGSCETAIDGTCEGQCEGECQGTASDVVCATPPNCGQNAECSNACAALVALKTPCEESTFEAYALRDPALLAAWRKLGARFSKPVQRIAQLRAAFGSIGQRTYGDFVAIGLKGPFIRSCVAYGNQNASAANDKIQVLTAVNPTARR